MGTSFEARRYYEAMDHDHTPLDHNKIPIDVISARTRKSLNEKLSDQKYLVSPENYPRDYRGLCDLMKIMPPATLYKCEDLMQALFKKWKQNQSDVTVGTFLRYLERIDRYDVYDDCIEAVDYDCLLYLKAPVGSSSSELSVPEQDAAQYAVTVEDVRSLDMGFGLHNYNAILLYDDADMAWADEIYRFLTSAGFSVCNRDNSFICNGKFEHEAFTELINRSVSVIVLFSPEFMNNPLLSSLCNYAQANNISSKLKQLTIPVVIPDVTIDLSGTFMQYQVKLKIDIAFWERLYASVKVNVRRDQNFLHQLPPPYSLNEYPSTQATPERSLPPGGQKGSLILPSQPHSQQFSDLACISTRSTEIEASSSTSEDLTTSESKELINDKKGKNSVKKFLEKGLSKAKTIISKRPAETAS